MLKVLLIGNHSVVLYAMRILLENADIPVVGEMNSGNNPETKVEETLPDLVVLDIGLPDIDGFQVMKLLHHHYLHIKNLVLSAQATTGDAGVFLN